QHASARFSLAVGHFLRRDLRTFRAEAERARALGREAATAPTLMPFGPYRHNARWLCVIVGGCEAMMRRVDFAAGVTGAVGSAPLGVPVGPAGGLGATCLHFDSERARRSRDDILAVMAGSRGYDEARTALLPLFVAWFEPEDARMLLTDWIDDEPKEL